MDSLHKPVLATELIKTLNVKPNGIYVDCTAGRGGHSELIVNSLNNKGRLICFDIDDEAIAYLKNKFAKYANVTIVKANFSEIKNVLQDLEIASVDGIIADLGVSSPMLDTPERGFSYHHDGCLDMRMDQTQKLDAWFVINKYDREQLILMFKKYGEINQPRFVVDGILKYRKTKTIDTTNELVTIIKDNVRKADLYKKKHPARTFFQAIRIEVNDELGSLEKLLNKAPEMLSLNGVFAVITFHSLEDRLVKQSFVRRVISQIPKEIPLIDENIKYNLMSKKAILASEKEMEENYRSHSAKVRALVRAKI